MSGLFRSGQNAAVANLMTTTQNGTTAAWGPNDAPILIVMGQSNSYGHGTTLPAGEQVATPYANVLTLDRTANGAALYKPGVTVADVAWVGLTTLGAHNVGTTTASGATDHTCNVANQFAKSWQDHITAGNALGLPNLHVILMGHGGQGIEGTLSSNRWNPDRTAADVESLYPRAVRTLHAAVTNLRNAGKRPRIIAVHWNQWETDTGTDISSLSYARNLSRLVSGINDALGGEVPWRFYWPISGAYDSTRTQRVRDSLAAFVAADPINRRFVDARQSPGYTGAAPNFGVFVADNVHYNIDTQKWFAQQEWALVSAGLRGAQADEVKGRVPALLQSSDGGALAQSVPPSTSWSANLYPVGNLAADVGSGLPGLSVATRTIWDFTLRSEVNPVIGKKVFRPRVTALVSGLPSANGLFLMLADKSASDAKFGYFEWQGVGNPDISITLATRATTAGQSWAGNGFSFLVLWIGAWFVGRKGANIGMSGQATGTDVDSGRPFAFVWDLTAMTSTGGPVRSMAWGGTPSAGVFGGTPTINTSNSSNSRLLVTGWPMDQLVRWRAGVRPQNNGTLTVEWFNVATQAWVVAIQQHNFAALMTGNAESGQFGLLCGMSTFNATLTAAEMDTVVSGFRAASIEFKSED